MSDTDLPLDMRQVLSQIDRNQAETRKLLAEAAKLQRDRFLAPVTLALTGVGTGAALFAAAQALFKLKGGT